MRSERIAYGQMVSQGVCKAGHVVIAALARVVWRMKSHTYIKANHQEVQVVTQTCSCAQGQVTSQTSQTELTVLHAFGTA